MEDMKAPVLKYKDMAPDEQEMMRGFAFGLRDSTKLKFAPDWIFEKLETKDPIMQVIQMIDDGFLKLDKLPITNFPKCVCGDCDMPEIKGVYAVKHYDFHYRVYRHLCIVIIGERNGREGFHFPPEMMN